jgi:hypothetical protein
MLTGRLATPPEVSEPLKVRPVELPPGPKTVAVKLTNAKAVLAEALGSAVRAPVKAPGIEAIMVNPSPGPGWMTNDRDASS